MSARVYSFDSLVEWFRAVPAPHPSLACLSAGWIGASVANATAWRFGWSDGVARLSSLPDIVPAASETGEVRRAWSDQDGDEMDMERYWDGAPFLARRFKAAGLRARLGPASVFVNVSERSGVSSDAMLWKAYAVAKLVDSLESTGRRVAVFVGSSARDCFTRGARDYALRIRVKAEDEPLNLSAVVGAASPWFLRLWVLSHISCHVDADANCGYPRALRGSEIVTDGAFVLDTGEALSKSDAARWLLQSAEQEERRAA